MKRKIFINAVAVFALLAMFAPAVTMADYKTCMSGVCATVSGVEGNDTCSSSDDCGDVFGTGLVATELSTTLGTREIQSTVADIINVALGLLGIVTVVIMLIGGFEWMTAGGNEEKVADARKRIFAGIIGLAIIMSSWALTSFVLSNLQQATQGTI
jgi:hypothetical protein